MNFFKKRNRHTVVSVLDHTNDHDTESNKLRRSSGGLKRSGGISLGNGYHDSETKRFEEPLFSDPPSSSLTKTTSNHTLLPDENFLQSETASAKVTLATHTELFDHSNNNNTYNLYMEYNSGDPVSTATEIVEDHKAVDEYNDTDSNLPANKKVKQLMTLYASIIRGEKSNVKKQLTASPELVEAPDNLGRTPLMYCVLADRLDCAKLLLKLKCKLDQVDKAGRSALHLAAHKASYKFLELLHERGGNIEMKDNDGQTPLHLTTRNHHARCLDFLLKRLSPGMAEVTDNQNRTALHWSAAFNNAECVKLLIKYKCNTAISDAEGKTPLHWAANTHDPTAVTTMKALLDSSPSALNWQDYEGRTALHFAVAHENVAVVEYLLNFEQQKCEVDRLDNTFRTPLHWAAQLGNTTIVKLLLSVGAKNSISDGHGATPLLYAALYDKPEVVTEMIKHDPNILDQADIEGRSALMWAAGKGANDVIQMLLKLNQPIVETPVTTNTDKSHGTEMSRSMKIVVDVNRTDNKGNTALHVAAWNGCARSAELLLNYNARHDLQNNMNHTPLFGACEKGHLNVVKHLLDCNASIFLRDIEERTPLHWAALGGHAEICDLLIKKGLDPDVRDAFQRSPLHCAAFGGFINCMNLLLETKANVDLQDQEGMSALHWAAQSGHLDASKLLFQCAAFPNLMEFTEERLTPLDHALLHNRDEVAQYLIEQGALSSETIRDIAAARIQACYRGYQVRKAFLHRKNLLMKHERLRNKCKKHRNRKTHLHPLLDDLSHVAEEPVPKSPNTESVIADSFYSGDESRTDTQDELTAKVKPIQSSGNLFVSSSSVCIGNILAETVNEETDENADYLRQTAKQEDSERSLYPIPSSLTRVIDLKLSPTVEDHFVTTSSQVSDDKSEDDESRQKVDAKSSHSEESTYPATVNDNSTELTTTDAASGNLINGIESNLNGDERPSSAVSSSRKSSFVSGAVSSNSEQNVEEKSKKKPLLSKSDQPATVTSDDGESDEPTSTFKNKKKPRKCHKRTPSKSGQLSPEKLLESKICSNSSSEDNCGYASSESSLHQSELSPQQNNLLVQIQTSLLKLKDESNSKANAEKIENIRESSFHHQTIDDSENVGSDEDIIVDPVRGLAYDNTDTSDNVLMPTSLHPEALNSSYFSSDLSLSEYIESLMSLSMSERKVLVMLQRNRKHAFKMANAAAKILQAAWRRYLKKKFPNRNFARTEEKSNDVSSENDSLLDSRLSSAKSSNLKSTKSNTPSVSRLPSAKSTNSKTTSSRTSSAFRVQNSKSLDSEPPKSISPPLFKLRSVKNTDLAKSSASSRASQHSTKQNASSKKRPKTSKNPTTSRPDDISPPYSVFRNANDSNDFVHASITSDTTSESQFLRPKKTRPKTIHGNRRKHSLAGAHDLTVNKKVQQLCKVYGQTNMLKELYVPERKSRFRTVTAPSQRPKTSKVPYSDDYGDLEFDEFASMQYQDPVTAVENSSIEWKSSTAKRTESLSISPKRDHVTTRKRKSFRRNRRIDEINPHYQPLNWQKLYGDHKMSSLLHPSQKSSRTRFSYNMRSANF